MHVILVPKSHWDSTTARLAATRAIRILVSDPGGEGSRREATLARGEGSRRGATLARGGRPETVPLMACRQHVPESRAH